MRTWDCACHGSSFDPDGQVLRGPAVHNLEVQDVSGAATPQGAART